MNNKLARAAIAGALVAGAGIGATYFGPSGASAQTPSSTASTQPDAPGTDAAPGTDTANDDIVVNLCGA